MARKKVSKKTLNSVQKRAQPDAKRQPSFKEALKSAEGRSEFAIVIFADIRGFSRFSKLHESRSNSQFY